MQHLKVRSVMIEQDACKVSLMMTMMMMMMMMMMTCRVRSSAQCNGKGGGREAPGEEHVR